MKHIKLKDIILDESIDTLVSSYMDMRAKNRIDPFQLCDFAEHVVTILEIWKQEDYIETVELASPLPNRPVGELDELHIRNTIIQESLS